MKKSSRNNHAVMFPFRAWCAVGAAGLLLALSLIALESSRAGADAFGQIGAAWGAPGEGNGQFHNPGLFGVDPSTGSVYTGQESDYQTIEGEATATQYRIQKLSLAGAYEASVKVPAWLGNNPSEKKLLTVTGIAVDPTAQRFYLVQGCRVNVGSSTCKTFGGVFNARRILVFKTTPESGNLVSAGELTLPEGSEQLYEPKSVAVDPKDGSVIILAGDASNHVVVQRFNATTGASITRFVDTTDKLQPATGPLPGLPGPPAAITVGPDGRVYTLTGGGEPGSEKTRAWRLPENLSTVEELPGFKAAAEREGWPAPLESAQRGFMNAPQIAVSPDGKTLYWKELDLVEEGEPGIYLVRGYSLETNNTRMLYGGGTEGACEITSHTAAIGATGEGSAERLVVFDFGPETKPGEAAPYGLKVVTFGPGGSGCPAPAADFTVNGSGSSLVKVENGAPVVFDATSSQLGGASAESYEWDFGDGSAPFVESGPELEPYATHRFQQDGVFTVALTITPSSGTPLTVERQVEVFSLAPPPEEEGGGSPGGGGGSSGGGSPGGGGSSGGGSNVVPPGGSGTAPTKPPTAKKPRSLAQKRAAARKKCKKLKGRARAKCMKRANSIGKKKHSRKHGRERTSSKGRG